VSRRLKIGLLTAAAVALVLAAAGIVLATDGGEDELTDAPPTGTPVASPTNPPASAVDPTATPTTRPDAPVANTPGGIAPSPASGTPPSLPSDREAVFAPIDDANVRVAESAPPQYFLYVLAGLPSGCAQPYATSVERQGDRVIVKVLNSTPKGAVACTAIYGTYERNLALGSNFTPGLTYTVDINDGARVLTFTAQ
jgi:hypothetical protein